MNYALQRERPRFWVMADCDGFSAVLLEQLNLSRGFLAYVVGRIRQRNHNCT
jgi:hypothetical protein